MGVVDVPWVETAVTPLLEAVAVVAACGMEGDHLEHNYRVLLRKWTNGHDNAVQISANSLFIFQLQVVIMSRAISENFIIRAGWAMSVPKNGSQQPYFKEQYYVHPALKTQLNT